MSAADVQKWVGHLVAGGEFDWREVPFGVHLAMLVHERVLDVLLRDGEITPGAYAALRAFADQLVWGLPSAACRYARGESGPLADGAWAAAQEARAVLLAPGRHLGGMRWGEDDEQGGAE